ncbi:ComEC family competence protein [Roseomonas sp. NAR14]|uniref:ComEC family competence protein n=1 Tax=Roseomonas acroporae TaxID=2937791 RepID=A0A9X1Y4Y5_9PROT|nr:ComEC/Rec2 family competence protein [Roseomonas acroporae]MCK8783528.1 ComEC family competence protein [Roseomonas acroporae]
MPRDTNQEENWLEPGALPGKGDAAARGRLQRALGALEARLLAERGRLPLWLPVALGGGILLYFALRFEPSAGWRWAAPALLALAWLAGRRHPHLGWAIGLPAAAALGIAVASWHTARQPPPLEPPRGAAVVMGTVQSVDLLPEGRRVTLFPVRFGPEAAPAARPVRLRLRAGDPARPEPGDLVRVRALVRPPSPPAQPGAWDFQRAAYFAGPGASGFAIGPAAVEPGDQGPPLLAGLRGAIEARVGRALPGAAGAVSAALLTGGVSAIPAADLAAMRDSGLAHLLSVSGLHIAIVMGVAFATARLPLSLWPWLSLRVPGKAAAGVAALAAGAFYLLLTGAQVPMQRSFATAALATLAILSGRRALGLRSLAVAAAAVMLLQPAQILGPSFQMSFAAVLALIVGLEALRPAMARLRGEGGWWRRGLVAVAGLVATSVLATIATTPFGLHHFGRLQWYGVAANAVAVPLTSVLVMPAGMLAAALMPLGLEGWPLWAMGRGVEGVLLVARWVASWPGAATMAPPLPAGGLALLALGALWLCLWRTGWRWWGLAGVAAGLAMMVTARPPDILVSGDARLIAVRTGEGVFVQRQPGASALVRETWLRGWTEAAASPMPRDSAVDGGRLACVPNLCTLRRDGAVVALLLRGAPAGEACGRAPLLLSPEPLRGHCRAGPGGSVVIDRFTVWREGAQAVWLAADGPRVLSDRAFRGQRPWVPPVPRPRASGEPMAETE